MKQPENTIVVKVAEYSLYITRLRVCRIAWLDDVVMPSGVAGV
jgi:hypothetical protein